MVTHVQLENSLVANPSEIPLHNPTPLARSVHSVMARLHFGVPDYRYLNAALPSQGIRYGFGASSFVLVPRSTKRTHYAADMNPRDSVTGLHLVAYPNIVSSCPDPFAVLTFLRSRCLCQFGIIPSRTVHTNIKPIMLKLIGNRDSPLINLPATFQTISYPA